MQKKRNFFKYFAGEYYDVGEMTFACLFCKPFQIAFEIVYLPPSVEQISLHAGIKVQLLFLLFQSYRAFFQIFLQKNPSERDTSKKKSDPTTVCSQLKKVLQMW